MKKDAGVGLLVRWGERSEEVRALVLTSVARQTLWQDD
jgi:hypothetical protein